MSQWNPNALTRSEWDYREEFLRYWTLEQGLLMARAEDDPWRERMRDVRVQLRRVFRHELAESDRRG